MRLDRLLAIVIKLLSHKRLTTQQLANEFGVSTRTIFRDLQSISLSNIPLVSNQGPQGGWEIMPDYLLDRRILSVDDIAHILSALNSVDRGLSHPSLKRTLDKMKSLIPLSKNKEVSQKMNTVIIDTHPWGMRKFQQTQLDIIHNAIIKTQHLTFDYHNLKKEKTKRKIEPMTLLLKGSSWYVFGYCLEKQDYRLFRLSRLQKLHLATTTFTRRNQDINDFRKDILHTENPIKLTLTFNKKNETVIGDCFGLDHATYKGNLGTIEIALPENEWLYSLLLGFGDIIHIVTPKRITDIIKTKAENILNLYA